MNDQLASIQLERANGSLLVRLSGEIDLSNSDTVASATRKRRRGLGLEWSSIFAEIKYLDSQGLRLIKQLCNKARKDGIELQLVAPPDGFARQVLEMARMSDYVEIRDALQ